MNRCEHCNVLIEGQSRCPLCGREIESGEKSAVFSYPVYEKNIEEQPKKQMPYKAAMITVSVVGICTLINLLTRGTSGMLWFLDIAVIFAYLWVLVLNTVKSKTKGSLKLIWQGCLVAAMLCIFNWNGGGGNWSVSFAIPFASMGFVTLAIYIVLTRKLSWSEYIGYMIAVVFLGQGAFTGVMLGLAELSWPSYVAVGYATFVFIMLLFFSNGQYKQNKVRRFRF